ncbi:hypothetical protein [Archangium sp.]|uniref:hypothetical protein n=1 Tax=Archangium sp. TaxID=1872627 RepID=UPI00389AD5CB
MSIRRIGFNPFVNTAAVIEAQKRIEAVEKHVGADDAEPMTEEEALASLNAQQQAELDALEAERAQREQESAELRAKLMLADGYEAAPKELVDLKGGVAERAPVADRAGAGKPGVSLAHLARANVYASVSRAERAEAERAALAQAEAERAAAEAAAASVDAGGGVEDNSWMEAELSALQAELEEVEGLDGAEEAYSDPGADSFVASLEDIENLEQGGAEFDDPHANDFVASLDDIAHLVPEPAPEVAIEPASEPVSEAALESAPEAVEQGGVGEPVADEPSVMLAEDVAALSVEVSSEAPVEAPAAVPVHGGSAEVSGAQPEAKPVGLPFDDEA